MKQTKLSLVTTTHSYSLLTTTLRRPHPTRSTATAAINAAQKARKTKAAKKAAITKARVANMKKARDARKK